MTTDEWLSLQPGDVISNQKGTNWRVVLSSKNGSIRIPSDRDWGRRGYTVYGRGDKRLFKKTGLRVKLIRRWHTITIAKDVTK